ncbi:MAG: methyltransferase domain-containing protein [Candidatus Contendobacter sp.]|nr:methyltransferase domain-containing protein [Candidatus Contendobacter sp.]MDG4559284.1 methyltransferase domain-containing protein [Candidatus Contendobacter sp.]
MRKIKLYKILRALTARVSIFRKHYCVVCEHHADTFLPYRSGWQGAPPLMRVLDLIGSNLDQFECPWCSAHDRERHLLMYMRASGIFDNIQSMSVLHFAPEQRLSKLIFSQNPARYIKCDLYPTAPDTERIDILAIPFMDKSFDLIIANHILEHVVDDTKALQEVWRTLKVGGRAILQTPYSQKLHHTWSDPGIDTDNACLQAYGQEDHVRLFGRDIFERITSVGLESCVSTHDQLLPQYDPKEYGVNGKEPFFLFKRPA